jgi:hypothetical protein
MPPISMAKGILLILGIAHLLAVIVLAFTLLVFNLTDYISSFSIILMVECVVCFIIATTGGITVPTRRVQGDKDPSHYTHDTWTGGGGFSTDSPVFLISGGILLLELLAIGLVMML